jgi:hypothetical protein
MMKLPLMIAVIVTASALAINGQPTTIEQYLADRLDDKFCAVRKDALAFRVFSEYGALYTADPRVTVPRRCVFDNDADVVRFQKSARTIVSYFGNAEIELQEAAMKELLSAVAEAESRGKRITPLDGSIAGKRSFADTGRLWNSRFHRALDYWVGQGKIDAVESDSLRWQPYRKQAEQVIKWEAADICFSTNFTRSIFASTAPPGTSQHLAMLAFDVVQHADAEVRRILNDHGWYQTIIGDAPHFTFLGVSESKLPERGLKNVVRGSHNYWVPNMSTVFEPQTAVK